jgi:hypothetical protein
MVALRAYVGKLLLRQKSPAASLPPDERMARLRAAKERSRKK